MPSDTPTPMPILSDSLRPPELEPDVETGVAETVTPVLVAAVVVLSPVYRFDNVFETVGIAVVVDNDTEDVIATPKGVILLAPPLLGTAYGTGIPGDTSFALSKQSLEFSEQTNVPPLPQEDICWKLPALAVNVNGVSSLLDMESQRRRDNSV